MGKGRRRKGMKDDGEKGRRTGEKGRTIAKSKEGRGKGT